MSGAWGRIPYRKRRLALAAALVLVAFAAAWGTGVFGRLSSGSDFTPPSSQSQREANQAARAFGRNDADVVVLYRSATMTVTDPAYRETVMAALDRLPRADVAAVTTYWSSGSPRPQDRGLLHGGPADVITIGLLALGAPFLRISWGGTDARALPGTSAVRQVPRRSAASSRSTRPPRSRRSPAGARAATPAG